MLPLLLLLLQPPPPQPPLYAAVERTLIRHAIDFRSAELAIRRAPGSGGRQQSHTSVP